MLLQSDGLRDIEPRHRTLNNAIDWSYQLLSTDEQTLFRRLGVFVGGWMFQAAEAVCLEDLKLTILDGLASLLDKSLIKQETGPDDEPRFTMLETIREYALERLVASGEWEALQQHHVDYFVALAENPSRLGFGVQRGLLWDYLEREHANYRAALAWSRTEVGGTTGLRLALGLSDFWHKRGYLSEGRSWLASVLIRHDRRMPLSQEVHLLRARTLEWLAVFCLFQGDPDAAEPHFEECLVLFRELGDSAGIADALNDYGMLFQMRGDYKRANAVYQESLALAHEIENPGLIRWGLFFLGTLAYVQGDGSQAGTFCWESLIRMRGANDMWGIAGALTCLAMVALDQVHYSQAGARLTESLIRMRELDERWQTVHTLEVFARLAAVQAQHLEDAQPFLFRSARLFGSAEVLRETFFYELSLHGSVGKITLRGRSFLHFEIEVSSNAVAAYREPTVIRPLIWGDHIGAMLIPELAGFASAVREQRG